MARPTYTPTKEEREHPSSDAAAGQWQTGTPVDYGRYLIEYEQGNVRRVFIGDYDPREDRWSSFPLNAKVLRWAHIHSPHN